MQLPDPKVVDTYVGNYEHLTEEEIPSILNGIAAHYLDDNMVLQRALDHIVTRRPDLKDAAARIVNEFLS